MLAAWQIAGFSPAVPDKDGFVKLYAGGKKQLPILLDGDMFIPYPIDLVEGPLIPEVWNGSRAKTALCSTLGERGRFFVPDIVQGLSMWAEQNGAIEAVLAANVTPVSRAGEWAVALYDGVPREPEVLEGILDYATRTAEADTERADFSILELVNNAVHVIGLLHGSFTILSGGQRLDIDHAQEGVREARLTAIKSIVGTLAMVKAPFAN